MNFDRQTILDRAKQALFGKRLVQNIFRAVLAEAIVEVGLDDGWRWMSADWSTYDFFHKASNTRLEVKQSAALQSWATNGRVSVPRFDIRQRPNMWGGDEVRWIHSTSRAELYVFCWHPVTDIDIADHADPRQWTFYVLRSDRLPTGNSIGLGPISRMAEPVTIDGLSTAVNALL